MQFLPDGTFEIEDPAAMKVPDPSSGGGMGARSSRPGPRISADETFNTSPFLDDATFRIRDDETLQVPDLNTWAGEPGFGARVSPFEPPVVPDSGFGSSWEAEWQQPGLITENWMQTISQDQHDWEKIGKSWDWLADCCEHCAPGEQGDPSAQVPQLCPSTIMSSTTCEQPPYWRDAHGGYAATGASSAVMATGANGECDPPNLWEFCKMMFDVTNTEEEWGQIHCVQHAMMTWIIRKILYDTIEGQIASGKIERPTMNLFGIEVPIPTAFLVQGAHSLWLGVGFEMIEPWIFDVITSGKMRAAAEAHAPGAWEKAWLQESYFDIHVYNPAGKECADEGQYTLAKAWCCCKKKLSNG